MNRRVFIQKSAALVAAGSIAGQDLWASSVAKRNKGRIGLQLWSVKRLMPNDVVGTLKKVSDIGYSSIETFGEFKKGDLTFGHTTKELGKIANDLGMTISGSMFQGWHMFPENVNAPEWDDWKYCISEIQSVGAKWAIQASMPGGKIKDMDGLKRVTDHFNRVGELCKQNGLKLAFHTHAPEFDFIDGVRIFDYLLDHTHPKQFFWQMDWGNVTNVGLDIMPYLPKYAGRFPLWHGTDYDATGRKSMIAGEGDTNYPALFARAKEFGLEQFTVEQHARQDDFEAITTVFNYFKQFVK